MTVNTKCYWGDYTCPHELSKRDNLLCTNCLLASILGRLETIEEHGLKERVY